MATNSIRRVRWNTRLGFYCGPSIKIYDLKSILPNGGTVPQIAAFIARIYPTMYLEKKLDGSYSTYELILSLLVEVCIVIFIFLVLALDPWTGLINMRLKTSNRYVFFVLFFFCFFAVWILLKFLKMYFAKVLPKLMLTLSRWTSNAIYSNFNKVYVFCGSLSFQQVSVCEIDFKLQLVL